MNTNPENSIEIELSEAGSNLYIFFGGIRAGIAMPPFEFYNSSRILDENKIFIRDFSQCWYQNGVPGLGSDIASVAGSIQTWIEKIQPERLFFVGNSMGGFAAILFAHLLGRGEVIAFAPQTFISPMLRLKHGDYRWMRQILHTYFIGLYKKGVWDLHPVVSGAGETPRVSIYISKEHRLDRVHASHLAGLPGILVTELESGGHSVVRALRDGGKLPSIMSGAASSHPD